MNAPFKYAHAVDADWTRCAQACTKKARAEAKTPHTTMVTHA